MVNCWVENSFSKGTNFKFFQIHLICIIWRNWCQKANWSVEVSFYIFWGWVAFLQKLSTKAHNSPSQMGSAVQLQFTQLWQGHYALFQNNPSIKPWNDSKRHLIAFQTQLCPMETSGSWSQLNPSKWKLPIT